MKTKNEILHLLSVYKPTAESKYGLTRIGIFGSVARGDDTEDSDIDILIISDYRSEIWEDIADMIGEIVLEKQELISAHIMSTKRFNTTQDYSFLSNVLAEGNVLV